MLERIELPQQPSVIAIVEYAAVLLIILVTGKFIFQNSIIGLQ